MENPDSPFFTAILNPEQVITVQSPCETPIPRQGLLYAGRSSAFSLRWSSALLRT